MLVEALCIIALYFFDQSENQKTQTNKKYKIPVEDQKKSFV